MRWNPLDVERACWALRACSAVRILGGALLTRMCSSYSSYTDWYMAGAGTRDARVGHKGK
jgi:hypothetical protein